MLVKPLVLIKIGIKSVINVSCHDILAGDLPFLFLGNRTDFETGLEFEI